MKAKGEGGWMRWLDGITDSMDMNLSIFWKIVKDRGAWCAAVSSWGHRESDTTSPLNDNIERNVL